MIDHLVYICHDANHTARQLGEALGVSFSPGGRHPTRGTLNRLLRISPHTYLELLASDPTNTTPGPRWMGIDLLPANTPARLSRWAWAVPNTAAPTDQLPFGPFEAGQRQLPDGNTLRWKLTQPGSQPLISEIPFLIDWLGQPNPAERLPDTGCTLEKLLVQGPAAPNLQPLVNLDPTLYLATGSVPKLVADLRGPGGTVMLQ